MGLELQLRGTIIQIGDLQKISDKFAKKEFVIETDDERFPQKVAFTTVNDKTTLTDGFAVGNVVSVSFNVRGNEYKGKYYVELNAWRIDGSESPAYEKPEDYQETPSGDDGNLPF